MLNRVLHREQNSRIPARSRLELEALGRHVGGGVKAVCSSLDGLGDQAGVFVDLRNDKYMEIRRVKVSMFKPC